LALLSLSVSTLYVGKYIGTRSQCCWVSRYVIAYVLCYMSVCVMLCLCLCRLCNHVFYVLSLV